MRISVIGAGYVGLVTGTCLAKLGHKIIIVDVNRDIVDKINRGILHIYENGLDSLLKKVLKTERLHASTDINKAVNETEITIVAVGTPPKKDGSIDLEYINGAAVGIGKALQKKDAYHTVVIKSTVIPKTTIDVVVPLLEKHSGKELSSSFGVAMNPEFLREGTAIDDFLNPDRIVIGSSDKKTYEILVKMYSDINSPVFRTDLTTAEMIKYASNAFLATKISFSNELGNLCKKLGIDVYNVTEGMGYDSRIERKFLNAGIGYGGSCFPKDVKALLNFSKKNGVVLRIIEAVDEVNEKQPLKIIDVLKKHVPSLKRKKIAVLGLSFKPGTDDVRESPSIKIINKLLLEDAEVRVHDPLAMQKYRSVIKGVTFSESPVQALRSADACLILTECDEFKKLGSDFNCMSEKIIIFGRRLNKEMDMVCTEGVCW